MLRRLAPLGPVLAATAADGAGTHRLAFYALLVAVPAGAVAALEAFGAALEGAGDRLQALLAGLALALTVLGEAARGPHLAENAVPALALSALVASVVMLALQALAALLAAPARFPLRPPA